MDRFPNESGFARYAGLAPIPAWSGSTIGRMRVCPFGNRQINTAIHRIAVVQLRLDCPGRAYYRRRRAEGDSGAKAVRCLKRRLCRVVFNRLRADYVGRPRLEPPTRRRAAPTGTLSARTKCSSGIRLASGTAAGTPRGRAAHPIRRCTVHRSTRTERRWKGRRPCGSRTRRNAARRRWSGTTAPSANCWAALGPPDERLSQRAESLCAPVRLARQC